MVMSGNKKFSALITPFHVGIHFVMSGSEIFSTGSVPFDEGSQLVTS